MIRASETVEEFVTKYEASSRSQDSLNIHRVTSHFSRKLKRIVREVKHLH